MNNYILDIEKVELLTAKFNKKSEKLSYVYKFFTNNNNIIIVEENETIDSIDEICSIIAEGLYLLGKHKDFYMWGSTNIEIIYDYEKENIKKVLALL